MPVEFISPGDRIITRRAGTARLTGLSTLSARVRAIRFASGGPGDPRPDCDLVLPAAQPVLVRDWRAKAFFGTRMALVRAEALVDGKNITDIGGRDMALWRLAFEAPQVIYAGGLELGSDIAPRLAISSAA